MNHGNEEGRHQLTSGLVRARCTSRTVNARIDLNGAVGRMVASVMFGLAEIELEYGQERQAAGIRVAKKQGVYRGRKKVTTKSKPGKAMQLRKRGLMVAEIATALNVSERTVFRYLGFDQRRSRRDTEQE